MIEESSDFCTIVSLIPFQIDEEKPGLVPKTYRIPPCVGGIPQVLHVTTARSYIQLDDERPAIVSRTPASDLARAIVRDYIDGQMCVSEDCLPGLGWLPGKLSATEILTKHVDFITKLREQNRRWFAALVRVADDDWNRYHSHKAISDFQRSACNSLSLTREWNVDVVEISKMVTCPSCGSSAKPEAATCGFCRCVLDEAKFEKLKYA